MPTKIKEINGTLRVSRVLEDELELPLIESYTPPPMHLNEYAVNVWNKTVPSLIETGVLSAVDMEMITAYCIEMGRYNEAVLLIKHNGSPLTKAPSGYAMIHPWYTIARQSLKIALEIGSMFGITPSGRTKIGGHKKPDENSLTALLRSKPSNL